MGAGQSGQSNSIMEKYFSFVYESMFFFEYLYARTHISTGQFKSSFPLIIYSNLANKTGWLSWNGELYFFLANSELHRDILVNVSSPVSWYFQLSPLNMSKNTPGVYLIQLSGIE